MFFYGFLQLTWKACLCSHGWSTYPSPGHVPLQKQGLLNHWFPLVRRGIKPLFRGGTWRAVGWAVIILGRPKPSYKVGPFDHYKWRQTFGPSKWPKQKGELGLSTPKLQKWVNNHTYRGPYSSIYNWFFGAHLQQESPLFPVKLDNFSSCWGPRSSIYNWNCQAFRSPQLLEVWVLLVGRNVATLAAAVEELSGLKVQVEKHGGSGGFVDGKKELRTSSLQRMGSGFL